MSKPLEGKVSVVTGAASGIGLATAKRLVKDGSIVFIADLHEDALAKAVSEIGSNAIPIVADVSKVSDIKKLFETVKDSPKGGRVDVLFANAGIAAAAPIGSISEELYDRIFSVNAKGVLFTVQEALPLLGKGSSVILTSSIDNFKGLPGYSLYGATKAAVRSFARTWTADLTKSRGIRVNVVSPGPIVTPMFEAGAGEVKAKIIASQVPIGRNGRPEEIANVVAFLASDASSFIAGAEIQADGGLAQI
ncbi:DEKNAAC101493 [Brettanomyces naardenensis]|uniref:DEKNAAC101493 n=1 Tax=Brettanomyces naardenensis TaxID=13370 RepID=A0A448YI67_BRENA|nr:DEKNAAC101493 [Brettanomyces naardenensis]